MAAKKTKKAAPKKAAAKKKAKKAAPKRSAAAMPSADTEEQGIPCICVKAKNKWFCMKFEDDGLVQCDGPFATKAECQEHRCI